MAPDDAHPSPADSLSCRLACSFLPCVPG
jgi:hypothetical protein